MNYIEQYWNEIESGNIVVCKRVRKQYERLMEDLSNNEVYVFDEAKANKPINFIEKFCKHSKGEWAGKPVILELFQKAFISALYGFVDKTTGFRRYRETMLYLARKNGKSTLAAGLAAYSLIADGEGGAEIYCLASKRDQAKIIFDETYNIIQQSPMLSKHVKKRKSDLYFPLTMSKMMPLAKNSNTLDGVNGSTIFIDELHSIQDRNLYEVMKQSQSARQQPLFIMITTAGTVREAIFDDMYSYACKIVDG